MNKEKLRSEINKEVHKYNDNWLNYDDETLKEICDSVFDLYTTEGCYESIEDCVSNVFEIYEKEESE